MTLGPKLVLYSPIRLGSTDLAILYGSSRPDGSVSPQSDAKKGSLYINTSATTDQSPLWVKVDENSSNDDWVNVMVDYDESTRTIEGAVTLATDTKIYLRDTGLYLYSPADGDAQLTVDGQFVLSGGSGLRLEGGAAPHDYLLLGPHQFDVSVSASLILGALRHSATGSYPAIQFAGCGALTAYADLQKVPARAASSGSVRADVLWSACTDGNAAVFRVGYDYIASGEGFGACSGSVILAASCVSASHITSSSIGNLPSFTAGDYVALRLQHDGSSASDDSGSTTDVLGLVLKYQVDRLGEH